MRPVTGIGSAPAREGWRHELKVVIAREALPAVEAHLRIHGAMVRQHHPDRVVQSIYLDTPERGDLVDAEEGVGRRCKVRIRWYGPDSDLIRAVLEVKGRDGGLGSKERWQAHRDVCVTGVPVTRWLRQALATFSPGAHAVVANRVPQAWIRYHRIYRSTTDGRVRVTIDHDVFSDVLSHRCLLDPRHLRSIGPVAVVEIKALGEHHDQAASLLQGLPGVVQRCSKYALAVQPGWWHAAQHAGDS